MIFTVRVPGRYGRPDAVKRLPLRAKWNADAVRDDVRQVVTDRLGDLDGRGELAGHRVQWPAAGTSARRPGR
ncbi:hypothetical protein [Micromonospora chersina]